MIEPAKTILIVEDDREIRQVALAVLEAEGCRVLDLANAARSLRPGLRVLYATGFASLVRLGRDRDLCGPVLRKPYRPGALRRAITALLEEVG